MGFFTEVNETVKNKKIDSYKDDPILYKNCELKNAQVIFITESYYSPKMIYTFNNFLRNTLKKDLYKYAIVSSMNIKTTPKDLEKGILDLYVNNKFDLKNIIPIDIPLVALGNSLYSLTDSSDLHYSDFNDFLTDCNSFYCPDLQCTIYPTPQYQQFIGKDNFEKKLFISQVRSALKPKESRRNKLYQHIEIKDTTKFFNDFKDKDIMACDIETDSLDWYIANIGDITFSFDGIKGYHLFWEDINLDEINNFLYGKKLIGMNFKYDAKVLIRNGIKRENIFIYFDLWQGQHVWKEDNMHNSLKAGTWRFTRHGGYDKDLDSYKKKYGIKNYLEIPPEIRIPYAIYDAIFTFEIYEKILNLFDKMDRENPLDNGWGVKRYFFDIVMPAVNDFLDIELAGIHINYKELQQMSKELSREIKEIRHKVYRAFDVNEEDININSGEQLGKLIESKGWLIEDRAKKGYPKTNDVCLQRWKKQEHEEAELLLLLKEKNAMMNTFVGIEKENSGFYQYIRKINDNEYIIYPALLAMLANSGRSKHRNPNTANISSKGDKARFIRRMFQPKNEDYVFCSADQSGLQLRLGAVESNDPVMRDIFINQSGDMHSMTAFNIFARNWTIDESSEEIYFDGSKGRDFTFEDFLKYKKTNDIIASYRFKAKAVSFGFLFGASALTFMINSLLPNWSIDDCEKYINDNNLSELKEELREDYYYKTKDRDFEVFLIYITVANDIRNKFFETYSGLADWIDNTKEKAIKQGYVRSIYGAFRRLPYLLYEGKDKDNKKYSNALNISLNSPIQNEESVIMNRAMHKIMNFMKDKSFKSRFFALVHDAYEIEPYKPELEVLCSVVKKYSEEDYPEYNGIPFELEGNISDYYATKDKGEDWELWDFNGKDWSNYLIKD